MTFGHGQSHVIQGQSRQILHINFGKIYMFILNFVDEKGNIHII